MAAAQVTIDLPLFVHRTRPHFIGDNLVVAPGYKNTAEDRPSVCFRTDSPRVYESRGFRFGRSCTSTCEWCLY
eukprot:scaffold128545_cov25-Prasinocladus_malaysianus.AAC.1